MQKPNKTLFLVALMAAAFVIPALRAQDKPDRPEGPPPPRHEKRREHMKQMADELGLSEDQKTRIKAIMHEGMEEGRAIREDVSLSREQKREKITAHRQGVEAKIDAVLTPEQRAKRKELRAAHPHGPEGDRPHHKKPQPTE